MSLTVCMYARNEERYIRESIESAIAMNPDEILLGDNNSEDNTRAIAEEMGVRVINVPDELFPQEGFAGAYNFVADQAQGDWVFNLLADCKVMNPEIVRPMIDSGFSDYYWVNFYRPNGRQGHYTNFHSSRHGRVYNKQNIRYFGLAHEDLHRVTNGRPKWLKPVICKVEIIHLHNSNEQDKKEDRHTVLEDWLLAKMVFNPSLRHSVNSFWFNEHYPQHKARVHKNVGRIREFYKDLPVEEWESKV